MPVSIFNYLFLVTVLSHNLVSCETTTYDEEPRSTFPFRRAIDGTRGRKYYDPEDDGFARNDGPSGRYDPDNQDNDFSDIRNNVPGEPGIDYPSYTRLPQTGFICESEFRGYYADEVAGCQVFHVCDGNFLVSSFLCPVGSVFSQKLLTCDWWTKVDCSSTRNYHVINSESLVSEVDDDEILRKAFEIGHSAAERIPAETINQEHQEGHDRGHRIVNTVTDRPSTHLQIDNYSDYPDYQAPVKSTFPLRNVQKSRQRISQDDYYVQDVDDEKESPIRVHTIGEDRRNDRNYRKNDFQPSYAPTVPSVITTTRRYYSPTFPTTTFRSSTERNYHRGRFDLEVDSSDHLYKARGRTEHSIKAATSASVASKITSDVSLATLVNSAGVNSIPEAETLHDNSSQYKTTMVLPFVENYTEPTVGKENTKTLSVIDNEDPDKYVYNHETEKKYKKDSAETSRFETNHKRNKLIAFLAPPQEEPPKFRITVLEDSHKNRQRAPKLDEVEDKRSKSAVEVLRSDKIPAIHITPPLLDAHEASRDSPVIRIKFNEEPRKNSSLFSDAESYGNDYGALIEDSEGEHSETKISEILPKEREAKNLTNDDATSFGLDSHSIGVINAAVALEQSGYNAAETTDASNSSEVEEEQNTGNAEKSIDILSNIKPTILKKQNVGDVEKSKDILSNVKLIVPENQNGADAEKSEEIPTTRYASILEKQNDESTQKSEESLLNTKTTISDKQTVGNDQKSEEILLSTVAMIVEEQNARNAYKSEESLLSGNTEIPKEQNSEKSVTEVSKSKNTVDSQTSITDESTSISSKTRKDKNSERSIDTAILSNTKTINNEKNSGNRSLSSEKTVSETKSSDSIVENERMENLKRRNAENINPIANKPESVDSIAAADYKSFEILKSDESAFNSRKSDSRNPRRIYLGSKEDISKIRSNNLHLKDYYRSIVALVNGPNLPRPFSLENLQSVEIRQTPSDFSTIASTSGFYGTEVKTVNQISARPPIKDSEKFSALSNLELSDKKVLEQLDQNFGKRKLKKEKGTFQLPEERRLLDFISGRPLEEDHRENDERDDEATDESKLKIAQINEEQSTDVETELIPSISFALNTDEEREEYMEAVMKGLLSDFRASESNNNETVSTIEI